MAVNRGVFLEHVDGLLAEHEQLQNMLQALSTENRNLQHKLMQGKADYSCIVPSERSSRSNGQQHGSHGAEASLGWNDGDASRCFPRGKLYCLAASKGDSVPGEASSDKASHNGSAAASPTRSVGMSASPTSGTAVGRRYSVVNMTHAVTNELCQATTAKEEVSKRTLRDRMKAILGKSHFDVGVGVLILVNTVMLSLQLQYDGAVLEQEQRLNSCRDRQCDVQSNTIELAFNIAEHIFTGVYVLELGARIGANGFSYLCACGNAADAFIVVTSTLDSWVLTPFGSDGLPDISILRLMRLLRLAKVLRVVRLMKAFKALRVLVTAVASSVGALAWSMTLLFILELMAAMFLSQLIKPFIEEADRSLESKEWLHKCFGTWTRSMLSVFEITMAPGGFIQYRDLYHEVHPMFAVFIVLYVCMVTFAVVRVITAMFLKATLSASEKEEAVQADATRRQKRAMGERLQRAFAQEDTDSVTITKDELEEILQIQGVVDWLAEIKLDPMEARRLFRALERGEGEVYFGDFINALLNMSGVPRAAHLIMTLHETGRILEQVVHLDSFIRRHLAASQEVMRQTSTYKGPTFTSTRQIGEESKDLYEEQTLYEEGDEVDPEQPPRLKHGLTRPLAAT